MKNVLVCGHGSTDRLTHRLQKLGFRLVLPPEKWMSGNRRPQAYLEGGVDVIVYLACTCCPGALNDLPMVSFVEAQQPIPIVVVRGGDFPGGSYLILGSVRVDDEDDVLVRAITNALKLTEEPQQRRKSSD